ncbi:lamin tail domain-containing protein [Mycolicibacterium fortuitum]|nr:lamin tail domain-containing protein [Mycolicibacterium fortuitum]
MIGNRATTAVSLHGWRLVDRNGRESKLDAELAAGASAVIVLDGSGVQLGNSGGNLLLVDDRGTQVDSVTYSRIDADVVDRYVRFQR